MTVIVAVSEKDFATLADAALSAEERGDVDQAKSLDTLARKISAALTNAKYSGVRNRGAFHVTSLRWQDVKTLLGRSQP